MTWIDVADSAVKIGLGALIAGVFGFASTKLTHDRGASAEYAKRRRDLLEKVLEMMNHFEKVYRHQKALFDTLLYTLTPQETSDCQKEFARLDEELRLAFEKFADASGILLMLGEISTESALDEYCEAANCWYEQSFSELAAMPPAQVDLLKKNIIKTRSVLMTRLAEAYKGV